jgi:predicted adenylyl cyclase CyaB
MKEVEVKIIGIEPATVEGKLRSLGASKISESDEETIFFDFPGGPIAGAKNLLRLRKTGNEAKLTFKKFVETTSAKVRDEYEVSVSAFEPMQFILRSLGLREILRMARHRISYRMKSGVRVDIDKYSGAYGHIPPLLEVEGEDVATVNAHVELLGFKPEDGKSWTTFDLVDHYADKKGQQN